MNGEVITVPFSPIGPKSTGGQGVFLDQGVIYNNLDSGFLSVDVLPSSPAKITPPPVGKGENTGEVFTGSIISFVIRTDKIIAKWAPEKTVGTSKGLPIVVLGKPSAPTLAVVRLLGPPEFVKLVPANIK